MNEWPKVTDTCLNELVEIDASIESSSGRRTAAETRVKRYLRELEAWSRDTGDDVSRYKGKLHALIADKLNKPDLPTNVRDVLDRALDLL